MRWLGWMTTVMCLALPRAGLAQVGGGQLAGPRHGRGWRGGARRDSHRDQHRDQRGAPHGVVVGGHLRDCRIAARGVSPRCRAERLSHRAA